MSADFRTHTILKAERQIAIKRLIVPGSLGINASDYGREGHVFKTIDGTNKIQLNVTEALTIDPRTSLYD